MFNELVVKALEKYSEAALRIGAMCPGDHELVMAVLYTEAEDSLRNELQEHFNCHYHAGEKCDDLANISKLFILTKDLWTGQYTVGAYIGDKDAFT